MKIDRRSITALIFFQSSGCSSGSDELPPITWGNEHYLYASDVEGPLCEATLETQGEMTAALMDKIFGPFASPRQFIYYALAEQSFSDAACPEAGGCYTSGRIFSRDPLNLHEIVHAVHDLSIGLSHPFFSEGIAEVFRDRYLGPQKIQSELGDGLNVSTGKLPYEQYGRAGHFMAYILDTFGEEVTRELLKRTRPGQTGEQIEDILSDLTGVPYEQLALDYAAYPPCNNLSYRWPITECAKTPSTWDGCQLQIREDVDCAAPDALGPREDEVWITRTLEIPANGVYGFSITGEPAAGAFVELGSCDGGCKQGGSYIRFEIGESRDLALESGDYYLSLVRGSHEPGELVVRVAQYAAGCDL